MNGILPLSDTHSRFASRKAFTWEEPRRTVRWLGVIAGVLALGAFALPAASGALIFADNFNAPDSNNLDNSDQTGRRSGLLGPSVQVRSSMVQHGIIGNQLDFLRTPTGPGRIRFQDASSLAWWDFATGPAGSQILADGQLRVEFDWFPANNTVDDWISFNIGFLGQSAGEPGFRVNEPQTDFGMLFRNNGGTQYFDNGAPTTGNPFDATGPLQHHVSLTYAFSSFLDGSNVTATAVVNGVTVLSQQPFQWENNGGALYIEVGTLAAGTRIDNLAISSVPEPASLLAFGTGALCLGVVRRRRCQRA